MRVRIFSSMLVFTIIVLVLLWIFQIVFLDDLYKGIKISNVNTAARELAENINSGDLKSIVRDYAVKYDTCITVWDSSLKQVASACVNKSCRVHTYHIVGAAYFYRMAEENGGIYTQTYGGRPQASTEGYRSSYGLLENDGFVTIDDENESMMYAEIVKDGDLEYLLLMNAVITPIRAVVQSLKRVFLFIALMMIILAFVISALISSYIVKPIDKINSSAKLLASGNYNVRFDENSYSEIAQLASTLNYAATELSSVEATRRELIANVSHDLRTPLTLISGYAEMMKDFPNDDNRENLQTIIDEVNHMTLLVNDMTDVSKYNAGVYKPNITEFDLTALVSDVALRLSKLNDPEGYAVEFKCDRHVYINADELKITQVLYNLINNAIIHTGEGNRVYITQEITEQGRNKYVRICITDNGKGITRENVKSIWDRYYKIDKTYRRAHSGSGLGLSIVKSILELHHMEYGVVPVEDMPDKKGCTFWFSAGITKSENKIK